MPRYEFQGSFYFPDQPTQTAFGVAVQNYIDSNRGTFFGYTPINRSQVDHAQVAYQLVQGRFSLHQDLTALFNAIKQQAQSRGAIAPSTMWLKTVADEGGVTEAIAADAPTWADHAI